jgi:hypothetical protein
MMHIGTVQSMGRPKPQKLYYSGQAEFTNQPTFRVNFTLNKFIGVPPPQVMTVIHTLLNKPM